MDLAIALPAQQGPDRKYPFNPFTGFNFENLGCNDFEEINQPPSSAGATSAITVSSKNKGSIAMRVLAKIQRIHQHRRAFHGMAALK